MDIDKRLELLTERHEALAQSVELLVAENRATGAMVRDTVALVDRHERELQRFRKVMRNALATWLQDGGEDDNPMAQI